MIATHKRYRPRTLVPVVLTLTSFAIGCATAHPTTTPKLATAVRTPQPTAIRVGPSPIHLYEQWRVDRADGPPLDVYIARKDQARRPLVIFLQGSPCLPLFMILERDGRRREKSTVLFHSDFEDQLGRADFAVIERPGLKSFGPPPETEEAAQAAAHCTPEHGGVSKDDRVRDVVDVASALATQPWVGPVYLLGHSEGAYVASGAAARLPRGALAGIGLLSGPGPTQFFDFILDARRHGNDSDVKQVFDELLWITSPRASGEYRGAAIERQLSYGVRSTTLDDLRDSDVPMFVANGTSDPKSPIEGADMFVAEMLRAASRRVHYLILPGLDHGYRNPSDGGEFASNVLSSFLDWVATDKDRAVQVGLAPH